jgi:hypothetical protein
MRCAPKLSTFQYFWILLARRKVLRSRLGRREACGAGCLVRLASGMFATTTKSVGAALGIRRDAGQTLTITPTCLGGMLR